MFHTTNNANLTINATGGGSATLSSTTKATDNFNVESAIFFNTGATLTINGGTYSNSGTAALPYCVDNYINAAVTNSSTVNINGGTFTSSKTVFREENNNATATGTFNLKNATATSTTSGVMDLKYSNTANVVNVVDIEDATLSAAKAALYITDWNDMQLTLTIKGSTIATTATAAENSCVYMYGGGATANVAVSGTTFTSSGDAKALYVDDDSSNLTINTDASLNDSNIVYNGAHFDGQYMLQTSATGYISVEGVADRGTDRTTNQLDGTKGAVRFMYEVNYDGTLTSYIIPLSIFKNAASGSELNSALSETKAVKNGDKADADMTGIPQKYFDTKIYATSKIVISYDGTTFWDKGQTVSVSGN